VLFKDLFVAVQSAQIYGDGKVTGPVPEADGSRAIGADGPVAALGIATFDAASPDRRRSGGWPIDQTLEHRGEIVKKARAACIGQGPGANHFAKKMKASGRS
jgi:hypothetical protein